MEEKIIEIDLTPAKLFIFYIKGHGISYKWIADNLNVTVSYVSQVLNGKFRLTEEMRQKMNELLETNY